jgi:hypothetical protein
LALLLLTPLGFATKLYAGPGARWIHDSAGGMVYEIFWILAVLFAAPRASPGRVALGVLAVTCALEALQLWHPPWLEALRAPFLGRALLGSTFSWWDYPYYVVGCLAGWALARALCARAGAGGAALR